MTLKEAVHELRRYGGGWMPKRRAWTVVERFLERTHGALITRVVGDPPNEEYWLCHDLALAGIGDGTEEGNHGEEKPCGS